MTLALALHGEAIATVEVQVKLNKPASVNVTVFPAVLALTTSVNM